MSVQLRDASIGDAAAIAMLLGELGYPAGPAAVAERLRRLSSRTAAAAYVAEENGAVLGVATLHLIDVIHEDAPRGQLTALVVSRAARRRGIGRALVEHVERAAAARGVVGLVVTTANHRLDTHEFYQRLGYEWTGRRYARRLASDAPSAPLP